MTATLYKIKDWAKHFETHESRKLKRLDWVAMPNKHDGLGFRLVAAEKDAPGLLAAWTLIVQIASKSSAGVRGTLERDGRPLNSRDIAVMTGFPATLFERAFSFFAQPRVGWLLAEQWQTDLPGFADEPAGDAGTPADAPGNLPRSAGTTPRGPRYRTGQDRTEYLATPAKPAGRARDVLFDSLAIAEGSDPNKVTKSAAGRIAQALAQIRAVEPNLQPSDIQAKARAYKRLHPTWELTATALAAHWAKLGGSVAPQLETDTEPEGWKAYWRDRFPPENFPKAERYENGEWKNVPNDIRKMIIEGLRERGRQ